MALLLTAGCSSDGAGPEEGVTVADVAQAETDGDGGIEVGDVVTVTGEVVRVVDPGAFLLGGDAADGPGVLVLSPTADFEAEGLDMTDVLPGDGDDVLVRVTGLVRELSLGEFQEDYAIPYEESVFEEYAGEAVIVAERLELAG
ncbi:hypothetical protein N868_02935 [Cellulomonas carbonis T26]|uniref:Lipoprotein n=1 Tax=Cellulomonas carbonis T26 TaxID=947969 RepID=A0A0A0BQF6_9CELL|nr:hypothetical protein N868_02935 [Cellulomonas carbonis T26]